MNIQLDLHEQRQVEIERIVTRHDWATQIILPLISVYKIPIRIYEPEHQEHMYMMVHHQSDEYSL